MVKYWLFFLSISLSLFSIEEKSNASAEYINNTYLEAVSLFKQGLYDESLSKIRHVIRSDMGNYNLRMLAAHCYLRKKKYEPAFAHFQAAEKNDASKEGPYLDQALAYKNLGEFGKGLRKLRKFERLSGKEYQYSPKFYNLKARLLFHLGQFKAALESAEKSKAAYSVNGKGIKDQIESILIESRVQLALENFAKAEILADWALSLKVNNPYTMNLMGQIYEKWSEKMVDDKKQEELINKAIASYEKGLDASGKNQALQKLIKQNLNSLQD
jgi:tetratricopeptide (TPR) repeat protein